MVKLHKKVIEALRPHLTDLHDALEDLPRGRVSGVIVSSSFKSLDHRARQNMLKRILKDRLSEEELSAIGAIAALTPAEANVTAS